MAMFNSSFAPEEQAPLPPKKENIASKTQILENNAGAGWAPGSMAIFNGSFNPELGGETIDDAKKHATIGEREQKTNTIGDASMRNNAENSPAQAFQPIKVIDADEERKNEQPPLLKKDSTKSFAAEVWKKAIKSSENSGKNLSQAAQEWAQGGSKSGGSLFQKSEREKLQIASKGSLWELRDFANGLKKKDGEKSFSSCSSAGKNNTSENGGSKKQQLESPSPKRNRSASDSKGKGGSSGSKKSRNNSTPSRSKNGSYSKGGSASSSKKSVEMLDSIKKAAQHFAYSDNSSGGFSPEEILEDAEAGPDNIYNIYNSQTWKEIAEAKSTLELPNSAGKLEQYSVCESDSEPEEADLAEAHKDSSELVDLYDRSQNWKGAHLTLNSEDEEANNSPENKNARKSPEESPAGTDSENISSLDGAVVKKQSAIRDIRDMIRADRDFDSVMDSDAVPAGLAEARSSAGAQSFVSAMEK